MQDYSPSFYSFNNDESIGIEYCQELSEKYHWYRYQYCIRKVSLILALTQYLKSIADTVGSNTNTVILTTLRVTGRQIHKPLCITGAMFTWTVVTTRPTLYHWSDSPSTSSCAWSPCWLCCWWHNHGTHSNFAFKPTTRPGEHDVLVYTVNSLSLIHIWRCRRRG